MHPKVSRIASLAEVKWSSLVKGAERKLYICVSKFLFSKNYLSEGPIYFAAGLIRISCLRCSK